jgi:hypothetical protein
MRYTRPADLNDPFEIALNARFPDKHPSKPGSPSLQLLNESLAAFRRSVEDLQSGLARTGVLDVGILCFTRTRHHLLMWGHYAVSHTGMLLEFEESHPCFHRECGTHALGSILGKLGDVVYSDTRPSITTLDADNVRRSAYTKSLEWAYEQEVRLLWPIGRADRYAANSGIALYDVPASALKSVTFGYYSTPETRGSAESILKREAPQVTVLRAEPNRDEFRLDYVPL